MLTKALIGPYVAIVILHIVIVIFILQHMKIYTNIISK